MDEFLILLQAKLDEAKSKGNINADIDKIQGQIDKLKVQAEIDPKTISNLVKQLEGVLNQKINISNIGIDTNSAVKAAQQTGQQIGNAINQGITNAASKANKTLKSFTELKIGTGNIDAILDKDGLLDAERSLNKIKQIYSEFGQVKITNKIFDPEGNLQQFRVDIQQVNGELKESRNFMMALSSDGKSFGFPQDVIKGSESFVHHLNEAKNISNATGEELNAQKEKLAEQEKYYTKLEQASKEQLAIEKQRITAGEKQLEILDAQNKRRDSRISYNEGQIVKKGLIDTSKQREINDLVYSGKEKLDTSFAKEIDKSLSSLSKLKEKWQEQGIYIDEFRTKVENLEKSLNEISIGDVKGLNDLKQQLSSLSTEAQNLNKINEIQLSIGDKGNTTAQIKILTDSFTKLGLSSDEVKTKMSGVDKELSTLQGLLNDGTNNSAIVSQFDKLNLALNETQNDLKITRSEYSLLVTDQQRLAKANVIEAWNFRNKNATQDVRVANEEYIKSLRDLNTEMTRMQFNNISDGFNRLKNSMTALGKVSTVVKGQISQASASIVSFMSLSRVVMKAVNAVTQMPSDVTALDTALVDLRKTANMSAQELEDFYYASNDVAKQMGVTTEEILNQASAWSRLGFNTAETATQMAKLSSQFALISPGLSIDDATSGLVSVMKAYDISVSDVLDGIESKINIIGNNLALSNANIVKMLQDSVSTMAESRNSLEETIALESAAYEITQNENVGNGFKTMALRLRGMNEETEELDESLTNIKGDLYELTGVSIMEDENTYKSTYQILKEISEVWDSLTDTTRAEALELMFGKLRSNIGAAVIKNFSAAEKAMDLMADSAGNADAELSIAMDSIEYKMNRLGETGTSVAQNLFQREDMKTVIDGLTSIAEVIDKVTEKLGLFGTIGLGAGLFSSIKNVGEPKMFGFNFCFEYADNNMCSLGY